MSFRDKKIVLMDFYSYEIGALEEYFEQMALKGWMLEKVSNLYVKFKKIESKHIKYTIDIIDGVSDNAEVDNDLALEYRENLLGLGWNYSCEFNKLQVFYKENESMKSSVSKKGKEEIECLFKNSLNKLLLRILFIGLISINQYSSIFRKRNLDYFASDENLLALVLLMIFTIVCIIDLFKLIKFKIYCDNNRKKESIYWIRIKGIIIGSIFLSAGIGIMNLILESNKEDFNLRITIFALLIGVLLFAYFIGNKKDSLKKKLIISSYFIITFVAIFLANNFMVSNILKNSSNESKNEEYLLSLKDFNDEIYNEEDLYIDENEGFLAHRLFYTANGKKIRLSYELFESNYKWMINWNFNRMMDWFEKQGISYKEIETNLPNEVKVFNNEKANNYIILSDNKIIEMIGLDGEEDKHKLLNIVYNKVFNDTKEERI